MLTDLHVPGDSPLHRVRPLAKILGLMGLCTGVFLVDAGWLVGALGAVVLAGYALAGLAARHAWAALRPALWVLAAIFAAQVWIAGPADAGFVVGRFGVLILAAALVTLTTRSSELVDGILAALHFAPRWVPKRRIALAISLCLRFIPLVRSVLAEIRQAQQARGLDRNLSAVLVPLVVRTLKTADEVAEAIYARSFD